MNTNVWLYGDHRAMRVGIGSDTGRSDCRYYHVLTLNLLADKPCWRKLSGAGNYDYKHIPDAEKEMLQKLRGNIHELTEAEAESLFMDRRSNMFTPRPEAARLWDEIMKAKEKPMKKQNERCPLQHECERTCNAAGHERDCDYYRANCLPGMDIPGQEVNTDDEPPCFAEDAEEDEEVYTSDCPYFIGMTEPDEEGKRQLLCKTREQPYNGELYDCGCSPESDPGFGGCRLYWLQKIKEDVGEAPKDILDGSVKAMREFYDQETANIANPTKAAPACPADAGAAAQSLSAAGTASLADGPAFDYSGLDGQTVAALHSAEEMIRGARRDYIIKVADAVGMAHDELVTNCHKQNNQYSEETFTAWCGSIGIERRTAYRLLQVSDLFSASSPIEQKVLAQASPSLLYAAAKPSAPAELVQGVKDGDITSHKQYKELEAQLKETERQKAEALAWKQHAEGQARDAVEAMHQAKQEAQEAERRVRELEARPIDVAVAEPDPAEVERLAAEKAAAMTAELRGQLKTAENNIRQMHAHTESLEGQLEDWREAARRQTPLTFENVLPMARDLASSVTALYSTFQLAACELHGGEYEQCAAPLADALQDALTGLRGAVSEHNISYYERSQSHD